MGRGKPIAWDKNGRAVVPPGPATNVERQRAFQRAHPGYDQRRKAIQRALIKRRVEAGEAAEALAAIPAPVETFVLPLPEWRLALPAPVESPDMAAINALRERLAALRSAETAVPISRESSV